MDVDDRQWRSSFAAVFLGAIRIARTVGRAFEHDASIAFVLSTSVRAPVPGMAISNGLRPGLGMVAKALSDELGPRGIRVNGLMPAWVSTWRAVELRAAGHDKPLNSLRRRGTAEEFGRVATFLLSPAASYVTGAMIAVDGGALPTILSSVVSAWSVSTLRGCARRLINRSARTTCDLPLTRGIQPKQLSGGGPPMSPRFRARRRKTHQYLTNP